MKRFLSIAAILGVFMSANANSECPQVLMKTNKGDITIDLMCDDAPNTTANFIQYVKDGFYTGVVFHRVIPGFMVQGGGFEPGMKQKATLAPIENEADNGLKNVTGSLSMARTGDPHSASSQFFINVADNAFLDFKAKNNQGWGYAVFAQVSAGMDVVNEIVAVQTGSKGGHQDVPVEDVIIESATLIK